MIRNVSLFMCVWLFICLFDVNEHGFRAKCLFYESVFIKTNKRATCSLFDFVFLNTSYKEFDSTNYLS